MKKIVALLSLTLFANFSHAQLNGFKKVPNVDPNVMYTFKTNPTADVLYKTSFINHFSINLIVYLSPNLNCICQQVN